MLKQWPSLLFSSLEHGILLPLPDRCLAGSSTWASLAFCPRLSSDRTFVKPARSPSQFPALSCLPLLLSALLWPQGPSDVSDALMGSLCLRLFLPRVWALDPLGQGPCLVSITHTAAGTQGSVRFAGCMDEGRKELVHQVLST